MQSRDGRRGRTFKGIISLLVLKSLWKEPGYGYLLEREVNKCLGQRLSNGEIYSIIRNLEIHGLVKARLGHETDRNRKYYEISSEGKKYLISQVKNLDLAMNSILDVIKFVHEETDGVSDKSTLKGIE